MASDWQDPADRAESNLRPSDRRFLVLCLVVSAAALAAGFHLYPRVNPEASIRFEVDRGSAAQIASDFAAELGLETAGRRHATQFKYDNHSKVFLERTLGPEEAIRLMSGPVRMWRWGNRWFLPGEKEEIRVEVATTGEIASFRHLVGESASGARLRPAAARRIAERFLAERMGVDLSDLEFLDLRTERLPNRTDHSFIWKRTGHEWDGGDYRLEVRIQGARPGAYHEYVYIPQEWSRSYERLRSHNETAGFVASALLILTFAAMMAVLLVRIRGKEVRWGTAFWFGAAGAVLTLLVGLNSLPASIYRYDTTGSFGGFIIQGLFMELARALAAGVLIALLTAAAEPLYREMYPDKFSLGRFFTLRGLRTRRFLLSAVLGLALTCCFFCYQEVFYTVARHFGAWAPVSVPYNNLFNTALPWVFILFIGFFPAVTEEFISRMFSIPFLKKHTRSTLLAIVVPAMIWGFAHSSYPNQPFYIRGIEVGIAGIIIGLIMLRTNVVAVLVWHYTVDALYSSFLLFRSGNAYYMVSAALAAGLILLPVGYAVFCYMRRGRFEDPAGLRNRDDVSTGVDALSGVPDPVSAEVAPCPSRPHAAARVPKDGSGSDRWRLATAGFALACVALLLAPSPGIRTGPWMQIGPEQALEEAAAFVTVLGEEPDSFRVSIVGTVHAPPMRAKYLMENGGLDRLRDQYDGITPPMAWSVRYYQPLQAREVLVRVNMADGRILSATRRLADSDSLPALSQARARRLAERFLQGRGIDISGMEPGAAVQESRESRVDHTFTWESADGDPRGAGPARHRVAASVQGDGIGSFGELLHIPEDWIRYRESTGTVDAIRLILMLLVPGCLLGLVLWTLLMRHRAGQIRWKPILLLSIPFGAVALIGGFNTWPGILQGYSTSVPWEVFLTSAMVGMTMSAGTGYLLAVVSIAVVTAFWPESWRMKDAKVRGAALGDALLGAVTAAVAILALRNLAWHLPAIWPEASLAPGIAPPQGAEATLPWFAIVHNVVRSTLLFTAAAAAVAGLLRLRERHRKAVAAAAMLTVLALVPLSAKGAGEYVLALGRAGLEFAVLLLLARYLLRRNLLAYPLAVYILAALSGVAPWLQAYGECFRGQGMIALAVLGLPVFWLCFTSFRARER